MGSGWCRSAARPNKPPEARKVMRPMVEIMVALKSFRILHYWLDLGKGWLDLEFAKLLNSVDAEKHSEANRRKGHIADEFCQSRNTH